MYGQNLGLNIWMAHGSQMFCVKFCSSDKFFCGYDQNQVFLL
jgi:hypothetical protein